MAWYWDSPGLIPLLAATQIAVDALMLPGGTRPPTRSVPAYPPLSRHAWNASDPSHGHTHTCWPRCCVGVHSHGVAHPHDSWASATDPAVNRTTPLERLLPINPQQRVDILGHKRFGCKRIHVNGLLGDASDVVVV